MSFTDLGKLAKRAGVNLDQPKITRIMQGKRDLSYEEARWLLPILWPDDPSVSGVSADQMEREIDRATDFLERTWVRTSERAGVPAQSVPAILPGLDAVAVSLASQANALTWGSVLIALVGIAGAVAWGRVVKGRAEQEARDEARRITEKWLADEAPGFIARHTEKLIDSSIGRADDEAASDEIGKEVG